MERHVDIPGALTATVGLAALCYAVIDGARQFGPIQIGATVAGAASLLAFVAIERRQRQPMMPLNLFRSRQFTGANLTTLAVYTGLGGAFFLVVLELQIALGYSALAAGVSLIPVTLIMLALSARFGALAQKTGPRLPMTVGPLIVAAGLVLFSRIHPGGRYFPDVLLAAVVFGLGLAMTVAPLTAAVLASVDDAHVGVGSAVNNAVARLAGLLSVAVLPTLVRLQTSPAAALTRGFHEAMLIAAAFAASGGLIAYATIRRSVPVRATTQPSLLQPCHAPELASPLDAA